MKASCANPIEVLLQKGLPNFERLMSMSYEPFYEKFRELAFNETRSVTTRSSPGLPDDDFGFLEAYCNDENCDCRRVMFNVASKKRKEIVAVIAYGWESEAFYARWYRRNDPDIIREMQGPILNLGSKQSELAPALLRLARKTLLIDPAYLERLKRHYQIFKEKVDPDHFPPSGNLEPNNRPISEAIRRHRTKRK